MGIRSTVYQMAGLAAVDLYWLVFEHKRALLLRVTGEADHILRRRSPHLLRSHRPMHVVAIAALDQTFIHPVVERHIELSFLLEVA